MAAGSKPPRPGRIYWWAFAVTPCKKAALERFESREERDRAMNGWRRAVESDAGAVCGRTLTRRTVREMVSFAQKCGWRISVLS